MYNPQETEKEILKFWKEKKIYEKSVKANSRGKKFYFMDGPTYATGHIHMGTALNKISKDIAMRSHRLQGFNVFDRPGYDTHGLPIEFQIEKEIGSKSKADIKKYGVKKFVSKCKSYATKYIDVMNDEFQNLGVWMDWKNPYMTLKNNYIETIWETFKVAHKKGLLYLGKYPVHVCPRCATAVAFNEIEYAKQEDNSVFVKFPLKNEKNSFLIIWTTTPWTLPGNTGVMVNPNVDYEELKVGKENWIVASELVKPLASEFGFSYSSKKKFKGKKMKGWEYENPLSKNLNVDVKNGYRVVLSSRYVTTEEGTGLVHTAPGHGKEDYEVGKENKLDVISPVNIDGTLTKEAGKYAGKKARVVDKEIIEDLKMDGFLVYQKKFSHDYPLCWRCKSSLLMISMPQWFFRIDDVHKKLLRSNKETNWVPKYMQLRMNAWLEGISDWPISRDRYWGTPLPIWICDSCNKEEVIGSFDELKKLSKKKIGEIHKPEIDLVKWKCDCGGVFTRVSEVLDVWFDSGVSSWAALDFTEDKSKFKKFWPADLNLEGKDQVRGWWNSQIILSELRFEKKPFENILVHGMVLDLGKKKMSKSKGNVTSPEEMIKKYGRDYLRYLFAKTSKGDDFAFDEGEFKEVRKVFNMLTNVNNFIEQLPRGKSKISKEDKWILSRFNSTIKEVSENYNSYHFPEVVSVLEKFLIEDLSRNYIKMVRDRSEEIYGTLNEIRVSLIKLFAPIIPFVSESIWQSLREKKIVKEESVHLSSWPRSEKINVKLEKQFSTLFEIIEIGLRERDKAGIGLKWPLAKAVVNSKESVSSELKEIIMNQLQVKKVEVVIKKDKEGSVEFDTEITPELEAEGFARNIARAVQALRKKQGLVKNDKISLKIFAGADLVLRLDEFREFLSERTNAKEFFIKENVEDIKGFAEDKINIKGEEIGVFVKKL